MNNVWGKFASVSIYTRRHSMPPIRTGVVEVRKRKQQVQERTWRGRSLEAY